MIFRDAGFMQADGDDGRVPDRREARFDAHGVVGFVLQFFQFVRGADDLRMVIRITERLEGDERIEHRRENRGQPVRAFKTFEHPLFGVFQRAFAEGMDFVFGEPFGQFVQAIQPQEKIPPRNRLRVGREREVAFMDAFGIKLVQIHRHRTGGFEMVDDGQGHEHGARPVAHLPEIHVEPFADEDDLAGDGWDVFPGKQAEQREIQFGKRVHARHAAEVERHFARLEQARVGDGHAGEFEREVGLDGGVYVRRAAVINVPAAVGQLHRKDVVDRLALPFLVHLAVPMVIRDRVGNERGVHHQFTHPIAVRLLQAEQIFLRPQNGGFQIPGKIRWPAGCRGRRRRLNPGTTFNHTPTLRIRAKTVKI